MILNPNFKAKTDQAHIPMSSIREGLDQVRARIAQAEQTAGRKPGSVKLLAVSKTRPVEDIITTINIGQHCFGESYVQEAVEKIRVLGDQTSLEWHFIGPIQSNKTALIARYFDWVHGVDRLKIAQRLNDQRPAGFDALDICIQVNTSGEDSKSGVQPEELPQLADSIMQCPHLKLRGLMTIPAPETNLEKRRMPFKQLRELYEQLNAQGMQLDTLSMGMTHDLEAAILEGATIVRIGTAIFGPRINRR